MFVLRSLEVRRTFICAGYGRTRGASCTLFLFAAGTTGRRTPTRRFRHQWMQDSHDPQHDRRGHAAGPPISWRWAWSPPAALLAACSSSSTPTTTTAPPGASSAPATPPIIAADLKAPAGSLTAAGSTFVQPFFTKAFYTYTGLNHGLQVNYSGVGSGNGITDFQAGTVDFAASDVPMSASDLAKMPASSGPVDPDPRHPRRCQHLLQPPRADQAAPAGRPHAGRHLRRLHQDLERLRRSRPSTPG